MGMAMEGVDIAVLYPDHRPEPHRARQPGPAALARALPGLQQLDRTSSAATAPDQLKFVAMLPVHDVHLACRELLRCVRELGAVGSFIRPNLVERPLLALELLGPALHAARGPRRDVGLPRGHRRAVLAHERALRREPLLPPRGQPLDRDAAGADRDDHRRRVRVPPEAPRRLPRGAELVGARAALAHRVGLPAVPRLPRARISP